MARGIPVKDWKRLRSLKDDALRKACDRIFDKISELNNTKGAESHKAYKRQWRLIKSENEQIALMFDNLKRSTCVFKLAMWKKNGILTEEDIEQFTINPAIEFTNGVMPDLIRHPVTFWIPAFAGMTINGKFYCRSNKETQDSIKAICDISR